MGKRNLILAGGLAAAVLGPIAAQSPESILEPAKKVWQSLAGTGEAKPKLSTPFSSGWNGPAGAANSGPTASPSWSGGDALARGPGPSPSVDPAVSRLSPNAYPLEEVLRFDLSPATINSRWPHVLAMTGTTDLQGYRVPLVTGTREEDLAGTLTYYFAPKPEMRRIQFKGVTGDPARLVALLSQRFGFVQESSPEPGIYLYQIRYRGRPNSELTLRMHDTIRSDRPLRRFYVDLEINLPDVLPSRSLTGDPRRKA